MRPPLNDPRLEVFADWNDKVKQELSLLFQRIIEGRTSARPMVARALNELSVVTADWANRTLSEVALEADQEAASALDSTREVYYEHLLNSVKMEIVDRLSRARVSVMSLANQISRHPVLIQRTSYDLTDVPVRIIGASGRSYTYSLDYYSIMVAHTAMGRLRSAVTLHRAASEGHPFVQITDEHSEDGSYCTAYRGRVFEILGNKNIYPNLNRTPSGGPPFHPWCNHTLRVYIPSEDIPSEMDERFLLAPGETNHYGIAKRWKEHNG